jgi:uncharacterized membrane protein
MPAVPADPGTAAATASRAGRRRPDRPLPRIADAVEQAPGLDQAAALFDRVSRTVVPRAGALRDELRGRSLGHPVHSILTDLPIGLWTAALALDVTRPSGHAAASRRLVALGLLAVPPTVLTGLTDFRALTSKQPRRVASAHAAFNTAGTLLALASWQARRSGRSGLGTVLSVAGMGAVGAGGFLGGHLAQAMHEPRHVPGAG